MTYYDYHLHHLTIDAKRPESHSQRSSWSSRGRLAGLESVDVEGSSNHPWVDTLGSIFVESWIQESDLCEMQCSEKHWNILKLRVTIWNAEIGIRWCNTVYWSVLWCKWHQMTSNDDLWLHNLSSQSSPAPSAGARSEGESSCCVRPWHQKWTMPCCEISLSIVLYGFMCI